MRDGKSTSSRAGWTPAWVISKLKNHHLLLGLSLDCHTVRTCPCNLTLTGTCPERAWSPIRAGPATMGLCADQLCCVQTTSAVCRPPPLSTDYLCCPQTSSTVHRPPPLSRDHLHCLQTTPLSTDRSAVYRPPLLPTTAPLAPEARQHGCP